MTSEEIDKRLKEPCPFAPEWNGKRHSMSVMADFETRACWCQWGCGLGWDEPLEKTW